jgi:hypothetical protein
LTRQKTFEVDVGMASMPTASYSAEEARQSCNPTLRLRGSEAPLKRYPHRQSLIHVDWMNGGVVSGNILRLFVGQGMTFVAIGIALGLAGAWALTRVMATLLFGVSATDPLTFAGVAFLLSIVALLACYLPARRAAKVDPLTSLRFE